MRAGSTVCRAVALLVCIAPSAGCGCGGHKEAEKAVAGGPVRDVGVRSRAEARIRRGVLADMRSHATPLDGPPFRANASCLTQTGSGSDYTLDCRATGYERPKALRRISGLPIDFKVASERWSVGVRNGRLSTVRRARGRSIGQSMMEHYNFACGDGSSSSGDPACH